MLVPADWAAIVVLFVGCQKAATAEGVRASELHRHFRHRPANAMPVLVCDPSAVQERKVGIDSQADRANIHRVGHRLPQLSRVVILDEGWRQGQMIAHHSWETTNVVTVQHAVAVQDYLVTGLD